jgi:hypothetical protein
VLSVLDLDAELAALTAPTAVLVGTADKLTPGVHAHGMVRALPHCTGLTELPGLGHMTPIEDAQAVGAVIRELAARFLPDASRDAPGDASGDVRADVPADPPASVPADETTKESA